MSEVTDGDNEVKDQFDQAVSKLLSGVEYLRPEIMSEEEAVEALRLPTKFPDYFYKIFGRENLERFLAILGHPDNVAMDMVAFTEDFGLEESEQYVACLPELQEFRLQLRSLARDFLSSMIADQRLSYAVRTSLQLGTEVKPDGYAYRTYGLKPDAGVLRMFKAIADLYKMLKPTQGASFRTGKIYECLTLLEVLLFEEIMKEVDRYRAKDFGHVSDADRKIIRDVFVINIPKFSLKYATFKCIAGKAVAPESVLAASMFARKIFENFWSRHRPELEKQINEFHVDTDNPDKLRMLDSLKVEEIQDLSSMKKPKLLCRRFGKFLISILMPHARATSTYVCAVSIRLENRNLDSGNLEDNMIFFLDRAGMEFDACFSTVRLADYLDPLVYEKLRSILLNFVLEALKANPEELEDLLLGDRRVADSSADLDEVEGDLVDSSADSGEVENVLNDDQAGIAKQATQVIETEESTARPREVWVGKFRKFLGKFRRPEKRSGDVARVADEVSGGVRSEVPALADSQPSRAKGLAELYPGVNFDKFKALSGRDVYAVLIALLGQPVRVRGSHYIFQDESGLAQPIPIHFGESVNRTILLKALRNWGLIEEFYEKI